MHVCMMQTLTNEMHKQEIHKKSFDDKLSHPCLQRAEKEREQRVTERDHPIVDQITLLDHRLAD
jgi:hypothetical protein